MTKTEALKALYEALGGDASEVADADTIVDVLNAIAAKYEGEDDATLNSEAIANIAAVADSISPDPTLITKSIFNNGTYNASSDDADGYSSVTVNVPAPTLTGFEDTTIAGNNNYAVVGYYNNTPTNIECKLAEIKTSEPFANFTVLGWVSPNIPGPVMG